MKSKIKIDLDYDNNPVLRIDVSSDTEDMRDKATQRFVQSRIGISNAFYLKPSGDSSIGLTHYEMYPMLNIDQLHDLKDKAWIILRAEAEQLLAKSLGFEEHEHTNGVIIWKDAEGLLYRWEKYGFGQLERKAGDIPSFIPKEQLSE